jgi:hypothetical protein
VDLRRSLVAGSAVAFALAVAAAFAGSALAEPSAGVGADQQRVDAPASDHLTTSTSKLAEHREAMTLAGACEADWDDDPTGELPATIGDRPVRVTRVWIAPRARCSLPDQTGLLRWAPKTSPPRVIGSV